MTEQLEHAQTKITQLEEALHSNRRIGMAVGILIERFQMSPEAAFVVLARASSYSGRKLRDIAQQLLLTGSLLAADDGTG